MFLMTVSEAPLVPPPARMTRACFLAVSRLATPCSVYAALAPLLVTLTVLPPFMELYQLYSHHWALGVFCAAAESPRLPLMFQYGRLPSTFSSSIPAIHWTIWPGSVRW